MEEDIMMHDYVVDLSLIGFNAVNFTNRLFYGDQNLADHMPKAISSSGKLHFFKIGHIVTVSELEGEAHKRGLILADPHSLCAYNRDNPEFSDTYPNATQWSDEKGEFVSISFSKWRDERSVEMFIQEDVWYDDWWFAGFSSYKTDR
jgi:hypothetical protein